MRNLYIFLLLLIGVGVFGQKKENLKTLCLSDEFRNELIKSNPEVGKRIDLLNEKIRNNSVNNKFTSSQPIITIPVAVFIVHANGPENISDTQVNSQIDILNYYFYDYGITFCLAKKNGINQSVSGISRYFSNALTDNDYSEASQLNNLFQYYPNDRYLKIFVVRDIVGTGSGSVQGYATFPNSSTNFDGIVMKASAFGNIATCNCTNLASYSENGKILVHEVGHYLGLYHTFEGGCPSSNSSCDSSGDFICDTPPVGLPNSGCPNSIGNCPGNLPHDINNYMDYVDEICMSHFTEGQKNRMINTIVISRANLVSEQNLSATGVTCLPTITATFSASSYNVCSNNGQVNFTGLNNPSGTTYSWDFGDGNISSLQSPVHTYSNANNSPYTVSLTVSDGVNSMVSRKIIYVDDCVPILNEESNWRFGFSAGLNFSSGVPVTQAFFPPDFQIHNYAESCANISDINGNFLFHSNGTNIMLVNNSVINSSLSGHRSAKDGVLILKNPSNQNQYYLFTKNASSLNEQTSRTGIRYTLVDVNNSTVSVNSTNVDIPVTFPSNLGYILTNGNSIEGGEGITAAKSCDGYWILTTGLKSTGYFLMVYKLNNQGLSFINEFSLPQSITTNLLSIEVSPNGNKLLLSATQRSFLSTTYFGQAILYDFDKFSGLISNPINLDLKYAYSASFSKNSNILYIVTADEIRLNSEILQYNLLSSDIVLSKKVLASSFSIGSLQMGPDNKIYISYNGKKNLGVIHKPNELITNNLNTCQFNEYGVVFNQNVNVSAGTGLPNLIDAKETTIFDNTISYYPSGCNTYKFFPNICVSNSLFWDFGDSSSSTELNPVHTFLPGTYTVILKDGVTNNILAMTNITVENNPTGVILGNDGACLMGNTITNNYTELLDSETALWSVSGGTIIGSNTLSNITINWSSLPGTITLTITNASGCSTTVTKIISSSVTPTFNPIAPICAGSSVNPLLTTSNNGITGTWSPAFNNMANGTYTFTPSTGYCANTVSLTVEVLPENDPSCSSNPCPTDLTLSTPETNNAIVYKTENWIKANSNYEVDGKNVTMKAGDSIVFEPNTHLKAGSVVTALIEVCSATSKMSTTVKGEEQYKEETSLDNTIRLFPNPVTDRLTIASHLETVKNITITALDGKIIYSNPEVNATKLELDIANYQNGIYLVAITTSNGITTIKKMIKN